MPTGRKKGRAGKLLAASPAFYVSRGAKISAASTANPWSAMSSLPLPGPRAAGGQKQLLSFSKIFKKDIVNLIP